MMENIEESPTAVIVASILSLLIVFGLHILKNAPITQNFRENINEYKQKMILSLVVKNGEIQNTNSWSFSKAGLYLLESFDML
jgi:phosphotransferase system  glucose/maltose/N-acetylglucosamine-specific IIC component